LESFIARSKGHKTTFFNLGLQLKGCIEGTTLATFEELKKRNFPRTLPQMLHAG